MQRRMQVIAGAAAAWLVVGCAAEARQQRREAEAKKLQEKHSFVQAVACLSPAEQKECEPGLSAAFASPESRWPADRGKGSIWCEGGRPHARISTPSGEATGEFGQVVWEAIWRVLKATDGCASAYGGAVAVTRGGRTRTCDDPRFDMRQLFDMARRQAKTGPPVVFNERPRHACERDPGLCLDLSTMCPFFFGDPWNGVRAKPPEGAASAATPAVEGDNRTTDGDGERRPDTPSQGEMSEVLTPLVKKARGCLKAGAPMAKAALVFQSDGTVRDVHVTGAPEPTAGCIEKTFEEARVRPFSKPIFVLSVTVRPSE